VGAWCKRPSGHKADEIHVEREQGALDEGKLQRCTAAPRAPAQMAFFDSVDSTDAQAEGRQIS
jgi:hypothetical protein